MTDTNSGRRLKMKNVTSQPKNRHQFWQEHEVLHHLYITLNSITIRYIIYTTLLKCLNKGSYNCWMKWVSQREFLIWNGSYIEQPHFHWPLILRKFRLWGYTLSSMVFHSDLILWGVPYNNTYTKRWESYIVTKTRLQS